MISTVKDTWFSRDLPVLEAAASLIEEGGRTRANDIAEHTGMDVEDVARAVRALRGEYVELMETGGNPGYWPVLRLTSAGLRAVGQWPSPESVVDALAEAFGQAAEREPDSEKKGRLRQVGSFLSSAGREVATEVVSKVILRSTGMG
jgi:hypothetical protein